MITLASGGHFGQAAWSTDGENIVVLHTGPDGYPEVEVLSGSGEHVRTVERSVQAVGPGWMDNRVVFLDRGLNGSAAKLKVSTDEGNQTLLTVSQAYYASWARAARVAVLVREIHGSHGLWTWNADSQELKQIWSKGPAQRVKVSPHGRLVAFTDERSATLLVHDVKAGTTRELWKVPSPGQALSGLAWSPDERYVGVTRTGSTNADGFYMISLAADAKPVRVLTDALVDPDWHPDGDRIVFSTVGNPGQNELKVVTLPSDWKDRLEK